MFTSEVQFGHAGSCANSDRETALAKNAALRKAGSAVPTSFDTLGNLHSYIPHNLTQKLDLIYSIGSSEAKSSFYKIKIVS